MIRDIMMKVYVTSEEQALIQAKAKLYNMSISTYLRAIALNPSKSLGVTANKLENFRTQAPLT